jgi:hypothetical protein
MSMFKWLAAAVLVIGIGVILFFSLLPRTEDVGNGDPETRIVDYLKKNVRPGQPVLVTELYNRVFTRREERAALQQLYDIFFKIPASAAEIYMKTGKIPTLEELSNQFQLKIPGEMDVLIRVMESDPRVPKFFERDPTSGEITRIYVDRIASDERFGRPLRNR